jgi:hypothetical protein
VAGVSSLIQWFFFRDRLGIWWVGVNAATGIGLGSLHKYLYSETGWGIGQQGILYAVWIIVNFVLGLILLRRAQEKSRDSSPIIETGARQNIFLALLSVSLVLGAISSIILVRELSYDLLRASWILYGTAAILTGISFIVKKEIPRNFGFITLAIFLLLDGINILRIAFNSDYPLYYFTLGGIFALVSGIFFISQKETWKNFGFIMSSGSLIMISAANMNVNSQDLNYTFLIISTLFAVPAAVFFFLRKERSQSL